MLGGALVASAAVVYALISVTAPAGSDTQQDVSNESVVTLASSVVASSSPSASKTSAGPLASEPTPALIASHSSPVSTDPSSTNKRAAGPPPTSGGQTDLAASTLTGSGIVLPAAWSGRANIRITALGACEANVTSTDTTSADLALNLPPTPAVPASIGASSAAPETTLDAGTSAASGTDPPRTGLPAESMTAVATATSTGPAEQAGPPADTATTDAPTLTLGINTSQIPSLSVYSSVTDNAGRQHYFWSVRLTPIAGRTYIDATLTNPGDPKISVNLLSDGATTQQPCSSHSAVGLPRPLAPGARITGWVDQTSADLSMTATTTDGERSVDVDITATRNP